MKKLLFVLFLLVAGGCKFSDAEGARKALKNQGYTDITIQSRWSGCAKDDSYVTGFRAKSPGGATVTGVVCSSWWKGSTIRTD